MTPLRSHPPAAETTIFVYGTLKRGGSNHGFLAAQKYVGDARTILGFTLYELDGYPGMVAEPTDREGVTGELWQVDAACLSALDELEGLAEGMYRRVAVPLGPPHQLERVEAYVYSRSVDGRRRIGSSWPA
jgi:gamma-glutamylaminecyclotransferase